MTGYITLRTDLAETRHKISLESELKFNEWLSLVNKTIIEFGFCAQPAKSRQALLDLADNSELNRLFWTKSGLQLSVESNQAITLVLVSH